MMSLAQERWLETCWRNGVIWTFIHSGIKTNHWCVEQRFNWTQWQHFIPRSIQSKKWDPFATCCHLHQKLSCFWIFLFSAAQPATLDSLTDLLYVDWRLVTIFFQTDFISQNKQRIYSFSFSGIKHLLCCYMCGKERVNRQVWGRAAEACGREINQNKPSDLNMNQWPHMKQPQWKQWDELRVAAEWALSQKHATCGRETTLCFHACLDWRAKGLPLFLPLWFSVLFSSRSSSVFCLWLRCRVWRWKRLLVRNTEVIGCPLCSASVLVHLSGL